MTLKITTNGRSILDHSTYATDDEAFPGMSVRHWTSRSKGDGFSIEAWDGRGEEVTIALGKTREEAITEFYKFIAAGINALNVLHTIEPQPRVPNFDYANFPMERPEYYAGTLYTNLGLENSGEFALHIGMELFEHHRKWSKP